MKVLFVVLGLFFSTYSKASVDPVEILAIGKDKIHLFEFTSEQREQLLIPLTSEQCSRGASNSLPIEIYEGQNFNYGDTEYELISIESLCFNKSARKKVQEVFTAPHMVKIFPYGVNGERVAKLKNDRGQYQYTSVKSLLPLIKFNETNLLYASGECLKNMFRGEKGSLRCARKIAKRQLKESCEAVSGTLDENSILETQAEFCGGEWMAERYCVKIEARCEVD